MHPECDMYSEINVFHFILQKYVFITPQSHHIVWRNTRYIMDRLCDKMCAHHSHYRYVIFTILWLNEAIAWICVHSMATICD